MAIALAVIVPIPPDGSEIITFGGEYIQHHHYLKIPL